jgi:hypothetical protein
VVAIVATGSASAGEASGTSAESPTQVAANMSPLAASLAFPRRVSHPLLREGFGFTHGAVRQVAHPLLGEGVTDRSRTVGLAHPLSGEAVAAARLVEVNRSGLERARRRRRSDR